MPKFSQLTKTLICAIGIASSYQAVYAEEPINAASGSLSTTQELTLGTVAGAAAIGVTAFALTHNSNDKTTPTPTKPTIKWEATGALTGGTVNALLAVNGKIYAGTNAGVAVSTDNGVHWSVTFPGPPILCLATDQQNNVYAGTRTSGVIVYDNQKQSWVTPNPNSIIMNGYNAVVQALTIDPKGAVYAGTYNGIYYSTDQGKTWSATKTAITDMVLNFATYNSTIYAATQNSTGSITNVYTSNDGLSWTEILTTSAISSSSAPPSMITDSNGALYLGLTDGIHFYSSTTKTWEIIDFNAAPVFALAVNPNTQDIYAGVQTGDTEAVYVCKHGTDCSQRNSWQSADPTAALANKVISAFIFNTIATKNNAQAKAYAATTNGIYTYDGNSWTPPADGSPISNNTINVLAQDATNVYAGSSGNGIYYVGKADQANSWISTKNNITAVDAQLRPLVLGNQIYVFSDQGLTTYSEDSKVWSINQNYPTTPSSAWGVPITTAAAAVDDKANIIYAAINGGSVFYSNNQGAVWNTTSVKQAYSLMVDQTGNVFVGTSKGVYSSADQGKTWKQTTFEPLTRASIRHIAADYNNGTTTIFAGARAPSDSTKISGIFIKNGDSEWQLSYNTTDSVKQLVVDANKHYVYATIGKLSVDPTQIYLYKDSTWNLAYTAPEGTYISALYVDPTNSNLYMVQAGNGLSISQDNAKTFKAIQTFAALNVYDLEVDPNSGYIYVGTINGGVYLSKDHGATWQQENSGLADTSIEFLFFDNSGNISAYTAGGPVYQGSLLTNMMHKTVARAFSPKANAAMSSMYNKSALMRPMHAHNKRVATL